MQIKSSTLGLLAHEQIHTLPLDQLIKQAIVVGYEFKYFICHA